MPSLSSLLGGVALIAALTAGFEYVVILQKDKTISDMNLAIKQVQIDQDNRDAALSAQILQAQQEKLEALRKAAAADIRQVMNASPTNTCGPVTRDAARLMQQRLGGSGTKAP